MAKQQSDFISLAPTPSRPRRENENQDLILFFKRRVTSKGSHLPVTPKTSDEKQRETHIHPSVFRAQLLLAPPAIMKKKERRSFQSPK